MSRRDVERVLSVSRWRIRALIAAGKLSTIRLPSFGGRSSRKLLFDPAEVHALIESSRHRVGGEPAAVAHV